VDKPFQSKSFHFDREDLWVEALIPGQEGLSPADVITFRVAAIKEMQSLGQKNASIKLDTGREIIFDISYGELRTKLREAEDRVLDLRDATNITPKDKLMKKLREEFKEAAEREKHAAFEALSFKAFVRTAKKTDFREFAFTGLDVKPGELSEGSSIMGGSYTKLELRDPAKHGFSTNEIIVEIPLAEFRALCAEATGKGFRELDLRDLSLRKGTVVPPEKRAAAGLAP